MRTYVYVDGFNLYFGALRGTPYRWLDLAAVCRLLLPRHTIAQIRYFTARVSARPGDPAQPQRQAAYLRALGTIPNLSIHYGHFLTHRVKMPLADRPGESVIVLKTQEKGSDVNLATYLLRDGFLDQYDAAVVVSNDSDLLEPIRIVRVELAKIVGILNPQRMPSRALVPHVTFGKQIRPHVLAASQFPVILRGREDFPRRTFHRTGDHAMLRWTGGAS